MRKVQDTVTAKSSLRYCGFQNGIRKKEGNLNEVWALVNNDISMLVI